MKNYNKVIFSIMIFCLLVECSINMNVCNASENTSNKNENIKNDISIDNEFFNKVKSNCMAFYLYEPVSKTVIASFNKDKKLEIASMVKIMTLSIIFDALNNNKIKYNDKVLISEKASKIEGSKILLDSGSEHTVENLIKSIVVSSANDSVLALAEKIAGSEENFVELMNYKAKELNMLNTHYVNATGLPNDKQYSSAEDVCKIFSYLLNFEKYYEFCKIWLEDYTHPSGRVTSMANTNKLIRYYKGCDTGKTGYTSVAKHCLTASAKRNNMRIISIVIGANSSKERFYDVSEMFNFAFNNYSNKVIFNKNQKVSTIKIKGSKEKNIDVYAKDNIFVFSKNNEKVDYKFNIIPIKDKASISKNEVVAKMQINYKNKEVFFDLVVNDYIKKANYLDSLNYIYSLW